MITLDNCQDWFEQQPEKLTFIQEGFRGDKKILCKLVKSETTREQWNKTVDKFTNCEVYRVEFENRNGELHSWVYFRESE